MKVERFSWFLIGVLVATGALLVAGIYDDLKTTRVQRAVRPIILRHCSLENTSFENLAICIDCEDNGQNSNVVFIDDPAVDYAKVREEFEQAKATAIPVKVEPCTISVDDNMAKSKFFKMLKKYGTVSLIGAGKYLTLKGDTISL